MTVESSRGLVKRETYPVERSRQLDNAAPALADQMLDGIDRQKRVVFAILAIFFGGFVGWSMEFDLASAVIAPGVISPEGARRPVQHFEGGIVSEVLVKDGDRVVKGQPLVVLQETRAKSQVDQFADQRAILQMRLQRLLAERRLEKTFEPDETAVRAELKQSDGRTVASSDNTINKELNDALKMEREIFNSRRDSLLSQEKILQSQIAQLREEIGGLNKQIQSVDQQLDLVKEEIVDLQTLFDKGLGRKPPLLERKRAQADLLGQRATAVARIARAKQTIAQTEAKISDLQTRYVEAADREMADVRTQLVKLGNQLQQSEDVLKRTTLTAPDTGYVVGLKKTSENAVVKGGEVIMEIVPEAAALVIDAQVAPTDIDDVHEGQTATVVLSAYKRRHMPRIEGALEYVSADSLMDERTGAHYFLARVAVNEEAIRKLAPNVKLSAGMPAEVMISTGKQTMFDYIVGPINQTLRRSFREK